MIALQSSQEADSLGSEYLVMVILVLHDYLVVYHMLIALATAEQQKDLV